MNQCNINKQCSACGFSSLCSMPKRQAPTLPSRNDGVVLMKKSDLQIIMDGLNAKDKVIKSHVEAAMLKDKEISELKKTIRLQFEVSDNLIKGFTDAVTELQSLRKKSAAQAEILKLLGVEEITVLQDVTFEDIVAKALGLV